MDDSGSEPRSGEAAERIDEDAIAVVGIGCRFPAANNLFEFSSLLEAGGSGLCRLDDADLIKAGVEPEIFSRKNYVRVAYPVPEFDCFDSAFFGMTAEEAVLLDPQQRVFLEVAWHALEDAGLVLDRGSRNIGVFAGANISTYLLVHLMPEISLGKPTRALEILLSNDKDYIATRISYKFDLHGPSVTVQSACSTSLVAVCQACSSLLNYECDAALAGGVAIRTPHRAGYVFEHGGVMSPDGICRPFDRRGEGTVFSNGAGVVVLKRLSDALENGDRIHALVRGFATNNDGCEKAGFTAPSASGQAAAISAAQEIAGIDPDKIGYVEAHGTGTPLGDPIEISALARVFGDGASRTAPCLIGSVKSNIGHCDSAAGIAGFIKAVMSVSRGLVPPSLHFEDPNPNLMLDRTPFKVCTELSKWPSIAGPRRAGVSSFGIGGTNAHVVIEQPPLPAEPGLHSRRWHIVACSARTIKSADASLSALAREMDASEPSSFPGLAASTVKHRSQMQHRAAVVARSPAEASRLLMGSAPRNGAPYRGVCTADKPDGVCMLFSGQIPLRCGIGRTLYTSEPSFRQALEACEEALEDREISGLVHNWLYSKSKNLAPNAEWWSPVVTFSFQYALTQIWLDRGVSASVVIGHSLGEYAAAVTAGVMDLKTAANAVTERCRLMHHRTDAGAMLIANAPFDKIREWIREDGSSVEIAAINGPANVALSGTREAIESYIPRLQARRAGFDWLSIPYAGHSSMMDCILPDFRKWFSGRTLRQGNIAMIPTIAGEELQVDDTEYWVMQLRRPVNFADALERCVDDGFRNFLEIGPKTSLALLGQMRWPGREFVWASSVHKEHEDEEQLAHVSAQLWANGCALDLAAIFRSDERIVYQGLPNYPFDRRRYWRDAPGLPKPAQIDIENADPEEACSGILRERILAAPADARADLLVEWLDSEIGALLGGSPLDGEQLRTGFFDLGIDSLKIVALAGALSDQLDIILPSTVLFENPTVLELADALVDYATEGGTDLAGTLTDEQLIDALESALSDRSVDP